ncbi:hypothetical protein ACC735_02120 [Rhizobium ruizarguesonis]
MIDIVNYGEGLGREACGQEVRRRGRRGRHHAGNACVMEIACMPEKSMQAPSSICSRGTIMAANAPPRVETHSLFQGRRDLFLFPCVFPRYSQALLRIPAARIFL